MTDAEHIEKWYIETHGELKKVEMITDVVSKGKTLIYGASGAGKTYSIIQHLNRFKKKPLLIDFDNNFKFDELDFSFVGGVDFLKGFYAKAGAKQPPKEMLEEIESATLKYFPQYQKSTFPDSEARRLSKPTKAMAKDMQNTYEDLFTQILDIEDKHGMLNPEAPSKNIFHIKNEIIIIDTCVKASVHFSEFSKFEGFINNLAKYNDVILIAHSKRYMNDEVPDVDEVFANHCDCRLQLLKTQSRSKETSSTLIVRKLRGYKGKDVIKDWER